MKVLVTGGAGFIGSNLCQLLIAEGVAVIAYDSFLHSPMPARKVDNVEYIRGDIRDGVRLRNAIRSCDAIVHLAASGSVVESVRNPYENYSTNVEGTFSVLESARLEGIGKLVFASTGGALMGNSPPPVSEKTLPAPISPYGASKLAGEAYCQAYSGSYDMDIVVLRFANVYGPYSAHKKGVLNKFLQAITSDTPITIYGDGSATRDYLYVDDITAGISRALNSSLSQKFNIFHLASGLELSLSDLAQLLFRTASNQVAINYLEPRAGEVEKTFADYSKARDILGFAPKISVEAGIMATWHWFLESGNLESR